MGACGNELSILSQARVMILWIHPAKQLTTKISFISKDMIQEGISLLFHVINRVYLMKGIGQVQCETCTSC